MVTSHNSLLPLLSILILAIVVPQADSSTTHDDYLKCLLSQNSNSISHIAYTPRNSSFSPILQSSEQNLRPRSTTPLKPTLILTPTRPSQIQAAIRCAKKHGIQIRVRSGGHDYEGLSFVSRTPFVIVDLRNISSIYVDKKTQTAWVQSGATLGQFYHEISKASKTLAFVAGACPTVGVGGHVSGGGYGMMSRKFGLAADHVIDAKIINVNGRILDRKSMGEDLFWAIRGAGGQSFGIITAWKVKLQTVPETVTVFNLTKTLEQNASEIFHKWQYVADKIDENLLMRPKVAVVKSENGNKTVQLAFISLFLGGVDQLIPLMQKSFPELGLKKEDCTETSWIKSALYFAGFSISQSIDVLTSRTPQGKAYFKGKSDFVRRPISKDGLEGIWKRALEEDKGLVEMQFSPFGGKLSEIPESETPFPHRAGNIYLIHYVIAWGESDNANARNHLSWIRKLYDYLTAYVSKSPRTAFLNYRDLDIGQNNIQGNTSYKQASIWGTKYYKSNFARLVQVKNKVDPSNFFRNEQSIPAAAL